MSHPGSILGLEKEEACQGYERRTTLQRFYIMEAWKKKKINNATYSSLIKEACKDKQAKVVVKVREILTGGHILEDEDMKTFREYLYECYTRELPHPSHTQWPQLHHEFYVDQVLYRKQKSKESKEDTTPIQLDQIFNDTSGKVVLIEGVAGSGKSTLLWHICKQWALGNLFQHFSLVIHTSLLNWEHDVRNLADIIPHPSKRLRYGVADNITKGQGRGVCFLIDDCSETVLKRIKLPQCMFLLTSRPSMDPHLNNIPHDEIALKGCKSDDFFEILLHNDVEGKKRIFYLLELKPELHALCELPLNAIILIFIHKMLNEDDMPVTRTDLFGLMLRNFLLRHIHRQEGHEDAMIENLEEDLTPEIHQNLISHCLLAYNSISANKSVISRRELKKLGISEKPDETLGLLQITRSVAVFGRDTHYSFPHLSIQEFLAALHIQWMRDEDREASAIQKLMNNDPLDPVITFYAGLTKLRNKKVQDTLMKVQNIQEDVFRPVRVTDTYDISTDIGRKHLAILNSIYESQDEDLVKKYTPKVLEDSSPHVPDIQVHWTSLLNFTFLPLYPSDCLSLAYYARLKLKSIKKESQLAISINHCSITDVGLEAFSNEMSKEVEEVTPGDFSLTLNNNKIITDRANRSITTLLSRCRIISLLCLDSCMLPGTVSTALKCIINGLNNSSLEGISLTNSHINNTHIHYLILLVCMNSNLCSLDLSGNDLNKAIPLLSSALIYSKIGCITLEDCNIDDVGLYCLFGVLRHRILFFMIDIDNNPHITPLGLKKCLSMLLEEHSFLTHLYLSTESLLNKENKEILEKINFIRRNIGFSLLHVGIGFERHTKDRLTYVERKSMDWMANNKELADKRLQKHLAKTYNSRSAH